MNLPIQNISLRGVFILGGGLALVVVVLSIVVSFFVTVTYQDAILKTKRISVLELTDPSPGKLFEIVDGEIKGRPLCNLVLTDDDLRGRDKTHIYNFFNVTSRIVPFIASINSVFLKHKKPESQVPNTTPFERVWIAKELYVQSFDNIEMNPDCTQDVRNALNSGAKVCTIDRAIVSADANQTVYAIGFKDKCLIMCPENRNNCQSDKFDILVDVKWTTKVKDWLDLIHLDKNSHGSMVQLNKGMMF